MEQKKGVGLNVNNQIHYNDHLAPICLVMGIPLLMTDEERAHEAQRLYPEVQITLADWRDITPKYLIENFDVFFQSDQWHRHKFYNTFKELEQEYNKTVRNVHLPHGFSDKVYWFKKAVWEDILLYYGDNMLDIFKVVGITHHLNAAVRTGNYRYLYYLKHKAFFDKIVEEEIWSRLEKSKPTILYAPTNLLEPKTASIFHSKDLFDNLPSDYNLIVKVHPNVEYVHSPTMHSLTGKYDRRSNVLFIRDYPLVYPILARSDIYVGDMSSIGYDFLAFNRPMFFLNQSKRNVKKDRNLYLYRCGFEIKPEQYKDFYKILESQLPFDKERYSSIRQEVYRYSFGEEVPFNSLKKAIIHSYQTPKKWV